MKGDSRFGGRSSDADEPLVSRLYRVLDALVRHFDVMAGSATDTRSFRERLADARDAASIEAVLAELEGHLLAVDERLSAEREREEKTLGYLQKQCEEMTQTLRLVQGVLEQSSAALDEQSSGLVVDLGDQNPRLQSIQNQAGTVSSQRREVGRVADRLLVVERSINDVRSGLRSRNDLALKDDTTGLYRLEGFELRARELFARWVRAGAPLSVAVVSLGLAGEGDLTPLARSELMRRAAADIDQRVRISDVLGLTADDCFTLLLPDTNLEGCHAFSSRMVLALEAMGLEHTDTTQRVAVTAGITSAVEGDSLESLLHRANQARDAAEAKGTCCEALI